MQRKVINETPKSTLQANFSLLLFYLRDVMMFSKNRIIEMSSIGFLLLAFRFRNIFVHTTKSHHSFCCSGCDRVTSDEFIEIINELFPLKMRCCCCASTRWSLCANIMRPTILFAANFYFWFSWDQLSYMVNATYISFRRDDSI